MIAMKDIAEMCGVSVKTVSNVINNHPNVRAGIRDRVLSAIRKTGYVPNLLARALVMGNAGPASQLGYRIGCIIVSGIKKYQDSYYLMIFKGIEEEIRKSGNQLVFIEVEDDLQKDPLRMNFLLSTGNADGIISFVGENSEVLSRAGKLPLVMVGENHNYDSVSIGKIEGIALLMGHLRNCGHRHVGFVGSTTDERFRAFMFELNHYGFECRPEWCFDEGFGFDAGHSAGERLMGLPDRPTSVLCASDMTAIGFVHAVCEKGLRVPDDISVTGYDDVPEAKLVYPPLTTVDVNKEGVGRLAVRALLERINHPEQDTCNRNLPVKLVVRNSVKDMVVK